MTSIFPGGEDWTDSPSTATALDAANLKSNESAIKAYDDALASAKELLPAQAVAVVNVALSGLTVVDGYTPVDGDRVLLSGQTASSQNGPWVAHSGAWTRPSDWVSGASVGSHHMLVSGGTAFRDTVWLMGVTAPIVVDTGAQVWSLPPVFASQLPASVGSGSVVAPATLGASGTLNLAGQANVWATYNLSTAALPGLLTLTNGIAGGIVRLRVQQPTGGGSSFAITDGTTTTVVPIASGTNAVSDVQVEIFSPTDYDVVVVAAGQGTPVPLAPTLNFAPTVSGSATVGSTLSCSTGSWAGAPIPTFAYQWNRDGSPISGATGLSYVSTPTDATHAITCVVTATNSSGSASSTSNGITPVSSPPGNTVAPAITGTPNTGFVLTCGAGTWTGTPSPTFAYQWNRDGSPISGATASTYTLVTADQTHAITCAVTGTNASGSASATSNSVTATAFDPTAYGTVAGWWKADAISPVADGTAISSWVDSSTNARPLVQATGSKQPVYKVAIQNGLPIVRFNGANAQALAAAFTQVQPVTVFLVLAHTAAYAATETVLCGAANTCEYSRRSSTTMALYAGAGPAPTVTTTPQSWHVHEVTFNGASSEISVDGATATTGNPGTNSMGGVIVGTNNLAGEAATFDLGESLVYAGTLTTPQKQAIQANLKLKWGTP